MPVTGSARASFANAIWNRGAGACAPAADTAAHDESGGRRRAPGRSGTGQSHRAYGSPNRGKRGYPPWMTTPGFVRRGSSWLRSWRRLRAVGAGRRRPPQPASFVVPEAVRLDRRLVIAVLVAAGDRHRAGAHSRAPRRALRRHGGVARRRRRLCALARHRPRRDRRRRTLSLRRVRDHHAAVLSRVEAGRRWIGPRAAGARRAARRHVRGVAAVVHPGPRRRDGRRVPEPRGDPLRPGLQRRGRPAGPAHAGSRPGRSGASAASPRWSSSSSRCSSRQCTSGSRSRTTRSGVRVAVFESAARGNSKLRSARNGACIRCRSSCTVSHAKINT